MLGAPQETSRRAIGKNSQEEENRTITFLT
jgi:hypothetical protein